MTFYTVMIKVGLLLRNISKMSCQFAEVCYNICTATFWQQKISKPARINDVIEVKIGVYLHKT